MAASRADGASMEDPKPDVATGNDGEEGEIEDDVQAQKVAQTALLQKKVLKRPIDEGGVYLPPAKRRLLRQQQQEAEEREREAAAAGEVGASTAATTAATPVANLQAQRDSWQDQKRVIHGTINRLNAGTIKPLIQELFQKANLVRLRGVLCKSVLQAAVSSPKYADVYAALISVVNSKLPEVGELAVKRSILAFRRHYKRREKASCQAVCIFLAHLFHQAVVHELVILQLLSVLLDGAPTDDSVEVAVQLLQVTGQALLEVSPAGVRACLERLRSLLHEGQLNKRVEYKMEQLLKMRKNGFREFPPISDDLDLVERDDQITFEITLDDDEIRKEEHLDVFHVDPDFQEHESEWAQIRGEILGEGDSSTDDSDDSDDDSDDDDDSSAGSQSDESAIPDQELAVVPAPAQQLAVVQDLTEADLVHLRRTIYLTIMSSATFEECTHKLARIEIPQGREAELINMLIECCSQERTFLRYYGLISARFCLLDDRWRDAFMFAFEEQYTTIHRLETNKLRNVAKLFAHLLHTDSIPWSVLAVIHLNEDETTSSSRIFIKIVIQEMAEAIGIAKLKARFETKEEEAAVWFAGMFPKDNVRNTRYAINFFTSIGLGPLTDDLREFLKNAPKLILAKAKEAALAKKSNDSDSSSVLSSSSSSSSSSSGSSSSSSSSSSYSKGSSYSSGTSGSYSDSSGGSSSSSSSSRRGRRKRRYSSSRSRSRSYSSSGSSRSYSSRSGSSASSGSRRSRGRRRGRDRRREISRSRSMSPPKEITKKSSASDDVSRDKKQRRNSSPKGDGSRNGEDRRSSADNKASRSPSPEEKGKGRPSNSARGREKDRRRSPSQSPNPKARRKERSSRSRSDSPDRKASRQSHRHDEKKRRSYSPSERDDRSNGSRRNSDPREEKRSERPRPRDEDRLNEPRDKKEDGSRSKHDSSRDPPRDSRKRKERSRSRSPSYSSSGSESSDSRSYQRRRRDKKRSNNRNSSSDRK